MLEFGVLGPVEARRDGEPLQLGGSRQRALLAILLLHAGEVVSSGRLIDDLFGESASEGSANALQQAVFRLRRALADETLVTQPPGYVLRVEAEQLDLFRFERLVREGQFQDALALWRGPALVDVSDFEFAQPEIRRLEELRLAAQMGWVDAQLADGNGGTLVPELETLVAAHPFQERLRAQLILALYRAGRQADALEELRNTRALLRDELGLEPSRALQDLERAILRQDESLETPPVAPAVVCPFKGLAPFDRADARFFCGRERLVDDLVARLAERSFVGVVGPSGVGKSSVLRAGLLEALAGGALPGSREWPASLIRPSAHPEPVSAVGGQVIAVDQFEELFTACEDEDERRAFVASLVAAAAERRAVVALALRADFYGRCAAYPDFARLLSSSHVLVGPMQPDELRRAITVPAERAGLDLEAGLADAMVADVSGEPGGLPLLQTALLELWRRRDGSRLRLAHYREAGGVRGAVGRLAEVTYDDLGEEGKETARSVLLRLAGGDADNPVRLRVPADELGGAEEVVRTLVDARLLTADDGSIEVAHEALLREWPRMRGWLEEERHSRRLEAHLRAAADEWDAGGRNTADLYRGPRLSTVLDHTGELGPLEREFVEASRLESQRELHAQKQRNRRLRALALGIFALLVLALFAGGAALIQRGNAQREARVALGRQLGAEAVSEPRIDRAMLLAREAVALSPSTQTDGTLLATLLRTPAAIATFTSPITARPQKLSVSPDGRTLAVADNDGAVRLYELASRTLRKTISNFGFGTAPLFTPDGRRMIDFAGRALPVLEVRDARSLRTLETLKFDHRFLSEQTDYRNAFVMRSGTLVFAYWVVRPDGSDGQAFLDEWNIVTGKRIVTARPLGIRGALALQAVPGNQIAVVGDTALLFLSADGSRVLRRVRFGAGVPWQPGEFAAISPNGEHLAVALPDQSIHLIGLFGSNAATPVRVTAPSGVIDLAFSPDSLTLAAASRNGTVTIWDSFAGTILDTFTGHSTRVLGLAFDAMGKTLYSCSLDGAIFAWDVGTSRRFGRPFVAASGQDAQAGPDETAVTPPLAISPDGRRFAVRRSRMRVAILETDTAHETREFDVQTGGDVAALAWSRKNVIAVSGNNGRVQLWSLDGRPRLVHAVHGLRSTTGFPEAVTTLAFSPDGSLLAGGDINHTAYNVQWRYGTTAVWEAGSGRLLWKVRSKRGWVTSVAFSPDGRTLAAADESGVVTLYAASSGRPVGTLRLEGGGGVSAAFAPDGTIATGDDAGIIQLWNPANGRELGKPTLVASAPVASIQFDPTGETFATAGGSDGFAKLWTTRTLRPLGNAFTGPQGPWGNAEFTPDGSRLVTIWEDGTGTVWPTSVAAWEEHACAVAGRNFTKSEWRQYVGGTAYRTTCPGQRAVSGA